MLEDANQRIRDLIDTEIAVVKAAWLNVDVVIPLGKFKGRKGRIVDIRYDDIFGICYILKPYSLNSNNKYYTHEDPLLLHDDIDCRRFQPFSRVDQLERWVD